MRAYLTHVRPLAEHNCVIWSPYTAQDIEAIESVQHRFTKRLLLVHSLPYTERLKLLNLPILELRRFHTDFILCCNILFRLTDRQAGYFFELAPLARTGDILTSYIGNIIPHGLDLASLVSALLTAGKC